MAMALNAAFVASFSKNSFFVFQRKDLPIDYKKCVIKYAGRKIPFIFDDELDLIWGTNNLIYGGYVVIVDDNNKSFIGKIITR